MPEYTLHSYFRSSCSARLRICLNLKSISYDIVPVNLLKNEQLDNSYRALNPSRTVPLLICHNAKNEDFTIGQSVAALEYLDEVHPEHSILPPSSDPEGRAVVRTLVNVISADIQPVTNLRVMRRIREAGMNAEEWNRQLMTDGFQAYESIVQRRAGEFSFGNDITMADVCLMPALWNAERFGVELERFPTLMKIFNNLKDHPAVIKAHYFNQPDTPENLRSK